MSEEQKKVTWNILRACFYLLASIIWAQIIMGYFIYGACVYAILVDGLPVGSCREVVPNLMELMVGGMAVVIAFAGRDGGPK